MKRAILLEHEPFEGPARLAPLLGELGYALDVRELFHGDPVPVRVGEGELLVVMGGPMGVADVDGTEFPFLRGEVDLLRGCIDQGSPVLGICLGAQLLAFAAGARVGPMTKSGGERAYEVGWGHVTFHPTDDDPILRGIPVELPVLHWHGDALELPRGSRRLASTEVCPNQGFQLGERLFGLQFHCEATLESVEDFLRADGDIVRRALGPDGVQQIRADTKRYLEPSWAASERLLRNILEHCAA